MCFWNLPLRFQEKTRNFLLVPSLVPSLFIVVSLGSLGDVVGWSFYGFWGVIIAHVLINVGLVSVGLHLATQSKAHLLQMGVVEGASPMKLRRIWLGLISGDILSLGLLVFSFCFTSFSIPVLLAGAKPLSLEVYMFQKLKITGHFGFPLVLGWLQVLFFVLLSQMFKQETSKTKNSIENLNFISFPKMSWLPFLPLCLFNPWFFKIFFYRTC